MANNQVKIDITADSGQAVQAVGELKLKIKELDNAGKEVGDGIDKGAQKANNSMGGLTGKIKSVSDSFTGLNGVIVGAMGAAGMTGFKSMTLDLTVARMKTKELMAATMGSHQAASAFYQELKTGTKSSVVQLDMMLNAMNGIKIGTGISNQALSEIRPTIQKVGEACLLMGDDTEHATFVMKEAMSGLNGDFQVLKEQFGITKEKMLDAGWSGAADDIKGYNDALLKCMEPMGEFSGVMDTTAGKLEKIKKNFRTAGLDIGEQFVPYIDAAVDSFLDLQEAGPLSEAILWVGGGVSALASIAPTISPIIDSLTQIKDLAKGVKDGFDTINIFKKDAETGLSKWDQVKKKMDSVKERIDGMNLGEKFSGIKESVLTKWSTLKSRIGDVKSSITGLNIGDKIKGVKDSVLNSFSTLKNRLTDAKNAATGLDLSGKITGIKESVISGITRLKDGLVAVKTAILESSVAETISTAATTAYTAVKSALTTVVTAATTAFKAFTATLLANPIILVVVAVVALVAILWHLYNTNEGVRNTINGIASAVKGTLIAAWNALVSALQPVIQGIQDLWNWLTQLGGTLNEAGNTLSGMFTDALHTVGETLSNLGTTIMETLSNLPQIISDALSGLGAAVVPGGGLTEGILALVAPLPTLLYGVFQRLAPTVVPAVMGFIDTVIGAFTGIGQGILNAFTQIPGLVIQALSGVINTITQWLTQATMIAGMLVTMLVQSIVTRFNLIVARVRMIFMMVVNAIRSRLMNAGTIAGTLASRVRQMIVTRFNQIIARVRQIFQNVVNTIRTRLGNAVSAARDKAREIYDNIKNKVSEIPQMVFDEFNKIKDKIREALDNAKSMAITKISELVSAVKSALGIASPGYIQRMVTWEFNSLPGIIEDNGLVAARNAGDAARGIVTAWTNNMESLTLPMEDNFDMWSIGNVMSSARLNMNAVTAPMTPVTPPGARPSGGLDMSTVNNNNDNATNIHVDKIELDCNNLTQQQSRQILYDALDGLYTGGV